MNNSSEEKKAPSFDVPACVFEMLEAFDAQEKSKKNTIKKFFKIICKKLAIGK